MFCYCDDSKKFWSLVGRNCQQQSLDAVLVHPAVMSLVSRGHRWPNGVVSRVQFRYSVGSEVLAAILSHFRMAFDLKAQWVGLYLYVYGMGVCFSSSACIFYFLFILLRWGLLCAPTFIKRRCQIVSTDQRKSQTNGEHSAKKMQI